MVRLRNLLIILVLLLANAGVVCACTDVKVTKQGYYMDCRGDIKNSPIKPPHPENIPAVSQLVTPLVDFEEYYKINMEGYKGREDKLPLIYGYTMNGTPRTGEFYDKEDYINIWCDGQKHVGKIDCLTDEYAISFFPLSSWSRGITTSAWRARGRSQTPVTALYIEDSAANSSAMYDAKQWAELWGAKIMFIGIDAGIPLEWVK